MEKRPDFIKGEDLDNTIRKQHWAETGNRKKPVSEELQLEIAYNNILFLSKSCICLPKIVIFVIEDE